MDSDRNKSDSVEIIAEATKALVAEYGSFYTSSPYSGSNGATITFLPNYDLRQVVQMVRSDPVAWGAITTLIDRTLEGGWRINDSDGIRDPASEDMLKGKGFDFWNREMLLYYFIFRNTFGELTLNPSGTLKELHKLDPTTTVPKADEHGYVKFYSQVGTQVTWQPEEIIHVRDPSLDLNDWGEISIKTVATAIAIKFHIKKLIQWLFETNQFRGIHNPKSADIEAIKRFVVNLKESERNISKPLIVEGEYDYHLVRNIEGFDQLIALLEKCDREILAQLQVPPIAIGIPDNSNRSNSDSQGGSLDTHIRSVQRLFEERYNEMLQKCKIYGKTFEYNKLISPQNEKLVMETAQIMKGMGMKPESITAYMRSKGLEFPAGELFDPLPDPLAAAGGNSALDPKAGSYPSRQGKGTGAANKKVGTGDNGTTRPDQMMVAKSDAFRGYPYEIEVLE